ncbi:MAG TPA: ATP-binding protein, partial [Chloroflexota bacterium]|nr:ATP-binding protein [Chloroflexota bacterium]
GSLTKGLVVRLDPAVSVEQMAVGRYVVVHGRERKFFGMVTDIRLGTAHPDIAGSPPGEEDDLLNAVLAGTGTYAEIDVATMLTIAHQDEGSAIVTPQPVKTVPTHFSASADATEADVASVFGGDDADHFHIGEPLDMDTKVYLNVNRLVERSSGIFGKSGTGKTFLTRLLLIGITQKKAAVTLVFDMHNEYGWAGTSEGNTRTVKGLKQLYPARVVIFTLDEQSSRQRRVPFDHVVEIGYDQIGPEEMDLLREAFDMTDAQIESIHRLARIYGADKWLARFIDLEAADREALAAEQGLNSGTLNVLHRKLEHRLTRLAFLRPKARDNSVTRILESLRSGRHVVLEFGRHRSLDAYILVANILTRHIHERYVEATEQAMGDNAALPPPLVITIEEAHKFLSPAVAGLTTFGTIAREMRKFNVTLLVVDQRPSGIADEVMSQIGTRITCLLDDEKDINAVLSGVPNGQSLRSVLSKLETKQQAIILGHAVPMPVVIRPRTYGTPASYEELTSGDRAGGTSSALDVDGIIDVETERRRRSLKAVEDLFE